MTAPNIFPRRSLLSSIAVMALTAAGCAKKPEDEPLTVAAAANLSEVTGLLVRSYELEGGKAPVFNFGSTSLLAKQIEEGAPFDVFAAADTGTVKALAGKGLIESDTQAVYAIGRLALWIPRGEELKVKSVRDLLKPSIRYVALARPESAPYGAASIEALKNMQLWGQLETKVTYTTSISATRDLAKGGNADAAFTALGLVQYDEGVVVEIDASTYSPLEQSVGIVKGTPRRAEAEQFLKFLKGNKAREILKQGGYNLPPAA